MALDAGRISPLGIMAGGTILDIALGELCM
jgi:hypothetical protein